MLTGPVLQHVAEAVNPPLTVTVYPGADGGFTWYEDAGDGYGYERGEYARVRLTWRDADRELILSGREGRWPGMPEEKEIRIALVGDPERVIHYTGDEIRIRL